MSSTEAIEEFNEHQSRVLRGDLVRQRIIGGLSRKDVAERMGIKARDVARIEEGQTDIFMSTLRRYCLAIGVVIDWQVLVPVEPEPEPSPDPAAVWDEGFTRGFYAGQGMPEGADASESNAANPYETEEVFA